MKTTDKKPIDEFFNTDDWVTCEECSDQIVACSPRFMLWTEEVFFEDGKYIGRYLCEDCSYDPEEHKPLTS